MSYTGHGRRGEGQQCVSDDQIRLSLWQVPDSLCALRVSERRFSVSCSTCIKADNNSCLIQYSILLHARKNYLAMITTQAKTPLLHTEHIYISIFTFQGTVYTEEIEILFHFNHTPLKLYPLSQHVTWTQTHTLPADHQKFMVNNEHEGWFFFLKLFSRKKKWRLDYLPDIS